MKSHASESDKQITKFFYLGIFFLSFSLLASEILLTRILSVIFWYHFAFLVLSVALFGMTVGALIVYLTPKIFLQELTHRRITLFAYYSSFACSLIIIFLFYLPAIFELLKISKLLIPVLYILLSIPFVTIGICLSLGLSRFPESIGKIYSVNLLGSALGCIGVIGILNTLNAVSAVFLISGICALSALFFALNSRPHRFPKNLITLTLLFFVFISFISNLYPNLIRPLWIKEEIQTRPRIYSKWNFFSYVTVGFPSRRPFGWGFSPKVSSLKVNTKELMLLIDEGAGTVLTKFNNLSDLEYLKLDVSSIAYYLRSNDDTLVLGSGGGRDMLTAVLFGAKKAVGVEINKDINNIAFNIFGNFSGSINNFSQIQRIVDEGRSFVSRSKEKYNIIQVSLVDSFAAFANGAFALTENSLYTQEAWAIFLKHLKEEGILTFSRWYDREQPLEIYRILALAKSALEAIGVENPRQNIAIIRHIGPNDKIGVGTILVSRSVFSDGELQILEKTCKDLEFDLVLSANICQDDNFISILKDSQIFKSFPLDISSPTDNRPFFFYFSKFKDIFSGKPADKGAFVLRELFITILFFGVIFIILPLLYKPKLKERASGNMMLYFMSIGIGFMLVEVALMQRLGIFLGHPIYGLTVVLFSLLFSCGIGSYLTKYLNSRLKTLLPFIALAIIISVFFYLLPLVIGVMTSNNMTIKISASVILLSIIGLFMGMPFPIGMRSVSREGSAGVLYWGINGFASVCGSALAAIILINFGFKDTLLTGLVFYIIAFLSLLPNIRSRS